MWPFWIGSRSPTRRRGTLPSRSPLGEHCEAKPSATRAREQRGAGEAGERSEPGSPASVPGPLTWPLTFSGRSPELTAHQGAKQMTDVSLLFFGQ